jgi:hypothetical protein
MKWRDALLRPTAPAERLGIFRVILGVYMFYELWISRASILGLRRSGAEHWSPAGVMQLIGGELPPAGAIAPLVYGTMVLFALWTLGLGWRLVGPATAVALLFLWSYRLSWGMVYHNFHLPFLHVLVVGVMPAAAACSLDARIGGRWLRYAGWSPPGIEEWTGRSLQIAGLIATCTYVVAGVAKVRANLGWSWISGHNLLDQIGYDALYKDLLSVGGSPVVPWLYAHPTLLGPLATISLCLELFAPIALLHRRLGYTWAINTWFMHLGIGVMMDIWFRYPTSFVAFLPFFPLEVPFRWVADRLRVARARLGR